MKQRFSTLSLMVATSMVLSACGAGDALGIGKKRAPDEFKVVKRAPLEIPYQLTLPVPQPGAPRPQETAPQDKAKQAVFGADEGQEKQVISEEGGARYATTSPQQMQPIMDDVEMVTTEPVLEPVDPETDTLLQKLNAKDVDPSIRQQLEEDFQEAEQTEVPVGKKLLNLANGDKEPTAEVVDSMAEYERLQKNKQEGLPVTEGETPSKPQ